MAAIRSGVTPGCLARCFLRQTGKPSRGNHPLSDMWNHRLLQKSRLHTVLECHSPATRTLLGRRQQGKFLWVNAVAVRHNSSQIPPGDGFMAAPASLPADPTPVIAQPITEQIPVETVSMTVPVLDVSPPVPTPVLTQPVFEQGADAAPTAVEVLQAATTETSLAELGLAANTPVGLVQNLLEFMHVDLGLPWWGAIVVGTVLARMAVFPVIVKGQREAAKLNNVLPEMTKLTAKMNEAKQSGNKFDFAKAYSDLNLFQKKNDVNPLRGFLIPMVQAPVFISFFIALRKMAYLPVPSLQTGGLLWFTDLTAADPFYILPVVVTGTMFFILELGAESGIDNANLRAMKTVFRIMPLVILPLTINFPTAVFTYWLTSNCFSLAQVALLRHPTIRNKLRIPERIKHPPSALPQSEGLIESMKKGWKNAQLAQQLEERERRIKNHLDLAAKVMTMSLCDDTLLCNFPKCRTKLSGFAWVTACSHVFCDQHGSGEFSQSPAICPACSSALSGKLDIVRTELSPPEEYKAMVLSGLRPDIVLDISARALAFWSYQVHQERMYQEYNLSRAEAQLKQMEKVLTQQNQSRELELTAMRGEIASLKKVMEEYKRKYSEVSERLMERNRQYQKLQGLYDSLRLRNMVVGVGERDALPQPGYHSFNSGVARQATPQRSPRFLSVGHDADSRLFSCLETDGAKTFFQFCSPARETGQTFMKKY